MRGAYNNISTLATQRCFYHLFTELVKVDKHNSSQGWKAFRKNLSRLMKDAIHLSENKEISTEHRDRLIVRLHIRLDEMIAEQYEDKDTKADHTANVATAAPEPSAPGRHVPVEEPNPAPVPMKDPDPSPAPMKNPEPPTPSRRSSGHRASMKG